MSERLIKCIVIALLLTQLTSFDSFAQTVVQYPPLVTDVPAHQKTYGRASSPSSSPESRVTNQKVTKVRKSRYTNLRKLQTTEEPWKINSKVVTSLGFGLAAVIALGLAAILGDDDDIATSSTTTTTSTE